MVMFAGSVERIHSKLIHDGKSLEPRMLDLFVRPHGRWDMLSENMVLGNVMLI
jgi:hypothetical protein